MADSTHVSNLAKCRFYLQVFLTYLFSHVGLFGLIIGYAFVGALIFETFEAEAEMSQRYYFDYKRQNFFTDLWNISNHILNLEEEYFRMLNARVRLYEKELFYATKDGALNLYGVDTGLQWTFSGALLYCITVIFTIGYGSISPRTGFGKVLTVFYASLGIPMSLLFFSNMGDIMARSFKFIYSRFGCLCCNRRTRNVVPSPKNVTGDRTKNGTHTEPPHLMQHVDVVSALRLLVRQNSFIGKHPVIETPEMCNNDEKSSTKEILSMPSTQTGNSALMMTSEATLDFNKRLHKDSMNNEDQRIPVSVVLLLLIGYICGGAVLFSMWENWSFLHAVFFCFMTLSTIGFGDKYLEVTFSDSDIPDAQNQKNKKFFCCIYLIIGLSIVAMCFKLLQEEIAIKFRNLGRTVRFIKSEENDDGNRDFSCQSLSNKINDDDKIIIKGSQDS